LVGKFVVCVRTVMFVGSARGILLASPTLSIATSSAQCSPILVFVHVVTVQVLQAFRISC
jgi:hypothetical protein